MEQSGELTSQLTDIAIRRLIRRGFKTTEPNDWHWDDFRSSDIAVRALLSPFHWKSVLMIVQTQQIRLHAASRAFPLNYNDSNTVLKAWNQNPQ